MAKAVPFEVSNVAEYLYRGTTQERWDVFKDFPGCMPPFERTWLEWKLPITTNSEGSTQVLESSKVFSRAACMFTCADSADDADWLHVQGNMFAEPHHGDLMAALPIVIFRVSKIDGHPDSPFGIPEGQMGRVGYLIPGMLPNEVDRVQREYPEIRQLCQESCSTMYPALLAVSLLNCRNVATREIAAPRQQVRHAERHGMPIAKTYRIIEIQPLIQQVERETETSGYSHAAAAIIRGHFKDYTQGNGLFGKLKGRFWWHQRVDGPVSRDFHYELSRSGGSLKKQWKRPSAAVQSPANLQDSTDGAQGGQ